MTTSADQPGATQESGPCNPLAMARAALAALNVAAASWDANEPHDLPLQDTERFLRAASACAQVAIAARLAALAGAVPALPAAGGPGAAGGRPGPAHTLPAEARRG